MFEKIKQLCKMNEISFSRLEKELKLANGSISKWKKIVPGIDKVIKVANYFNVSVDDLVDRKDYAISDESRKLALKYEALSSDKQNLVQCYISVIDSERS